MDTGSPAGLSVSEDVNISNELKRLCLEPSVSIHHAQVDASLNELREDLTKFLHIQDVQELVSESTLHQPSEKTDNDYVKEDECINLDEVNSVNCEICLPRCASLPCLGEISLHAVTTGGDQRDKVFDNGEDDITAAKPKHEVHEPVEPSYPISISLPNPLKLVSAMKGSREKQGKPLTKLTVTWAPDVYDPPPSASTFVRIKKPKKNYESKRYGKYKQKGKTKGGSSKDKRQVRRHSGSSSKFYQPLDDRGRVLYDRSCQDLVAFDIGGTDSYCGSSFLKKSTPKLHFSIAEAT